MQGDLEGALKHHAEATRIEPANADGWMNYGNALKAVGHLDAATKVALREREKERERESGFRVRVSGSTPMSAPLPREKGTTYKV